MITNRCGINLGSKILEEAKQILQVGNFWGKMPFLNNIIKKAFKKGFQKNRIIIIEKQIVDGLSSWLNQNKIKTLFNPSTEEIRTATSISEPYFFLLTFKEYNKWQEIKEFRREFERLPNPLNLREISKHSEITIEQVFESFSEVEALPPCTRDVIEIEETTLSNLVILLCLYKNFLSFCFEKRFCTAEKLQKCKRCWSKFSLALKSEFYDLIKSNEVYYPISIYMHHRFPYIHRYIDLNSYVKDFNSLLDFAIFLHDAYQMGIIIYPGFGLTLDIDDKPDAYLLDYIYPLKKELVCERIASLLFFEAIKKKSSEIKNTLKNLKKKIEKLPEGNKVNKIISKFSLIMRNCYDLWQFNKEEIIILYSIWKMKKIFKSLFQKVKVGLRTIDSVKNRSTLQLIYSNLYDYKDFLEINLAVNLGITNLDLIKEFFNNIKTIDRSKKHIVPLELLLQLGHRDVMKKIWASTFDYSSKKILASKIYEGIISILDEIQKLDSEQIIKLSPYFLEFYEYPIFDFEEKAVLLNTLQKKECDQTKDIINLIKGTIYEEILTGLSLSYEIDKLINQWSTGNPLYFFANEIDKKIENDEFDSTLFNNYLKFFFSINTLKLFRQFPQKYFIYQRTLDRYISLQLKESEKYYFDYFKPISSIFDLIIKLREKKKKVILLIFDGLGFLHFYFACLETYHREPKEIKNFLELLLGILERKKCTILSSYIPTVTGVNHIALLFGERLLYDDSFAVRLSDKLFMQDKREKAPRIFSMLKLNESHRKAALWKDRLIESGIQKPTTLWSMLGKEIIKKGLFISANSEHTLLSYLLKGEATFKQVDSYANAIEAALSDKKHDVIISQVNLMDAFLQALNTRYPPAFFDDIVNGYWEVYLDLWKSIIARLFKYFKRLRKGTVVIITGDHGLAWGQTSEFKDVQKILSSTQNIKFEPKHRVGGILKNSQIIGSYIPGHTSRKFMSVFLLKGGLNDKQRIREKLELEQQNGEIVFRKVQIDKDKLDGTIKPDFLVFPTVGMFASRRRRKYYGGIHGGISVCELFIPLIQIEK